MSFTSVFADLNKIKTEYGDTLLLYEANKLELVAFLLDKGLDANARNNTLKTSLYKGWNKTGSYRKTNCHGADVNARDDSGYTPLIPYYVSSNFEKAKILLMNGGDPNASNGDYLSYSPLTATDNPRVTELLIYHGAKTILTI
jgi:ankyrin repeat protein